MATTPNNAPIANATSFTADLISIVDAKDKSDTGSFALIHKHREDVADLFRTVDAARNVKDMSVRSVLTDHFGMDKRGARILNRYEELKQISNPSAIQRMEKAQIKRKINAVVVTLTRLVDVFVGISKVEDAGFVVEYRSTNMTAGTICRIRGPKDDDFAPFSVAQILRLCDKDVSGFTSYAQLQERAKTQKAGTANNQPAAGSAEAVGANLSRVAEGVTNAIAGLSFAKDGGIAPAARNNLAHLWALLDDMMSDEQKAAARKAYEEGVADDDDESAAA